MPVATVRRPPVVAPPAADVDDRAARRALRGQISRLDRDIGRLVAATFPHLGAGPPAPALGGPRGRAGQRVPCAICRQGETDSNR